MKPLCDSCEAEGELVEATQAGNPGLFPARATF